MGQTQTVVRVAVTPSTTAPPDHRHEAARTVERDSTEVVRVQGFVKRYGKIVAGDGVDLSVKRGEIYGLIGPDGAGKSSLMKAIAGVLTFDAGEVEVFDVKLESEAASERIKGRIGLMPQGLGLNLYGELSVEENINFFARLHLVDKKVLEERKSRLLAITRLDKFRERPMKQLSGGMKQKLGLVCTLIHEPELVILDEPTTGVDPVSRRDFWAILAELLQEKGITALVSTAYMDEASRFHRVALMFGGRILASGEPDAVQALAPGSVVALQAADPVRGLERLKTRFPQVEVLGPWLKVFVDGADATAARRVVQEALEEIAFEGLYAGQPELEDVFIALLRREQLVAASASQHVLAVQSDIQRKDGVAIEALELTRDFGGFRAVERASFRVLQGEIFGLLGANGAGKTTAIKMLTGLIRPTAGSGRVAGADMRVASHEIKERIGYMSQAFSLYMDLTVIENIRLYAGIYGLGARETKARAAWLIEMAGLSGHEASATASLPMGLRQRLALGCALVHRPQVLFLDEPTSGVDPVGRRQFWDILFALSRTEGVAILVTTHYMSEAEHCDRLALMYAGRIVADASPSQMKREVETEAGRLLEIAANPPQRSIAVLRDAGYAETALFGKRVHLLSKNVDDDLQRIPAVLASAGLEVADIALRPLTMEDVFVYRVTALEAKERTATGTRT